MKYTYSIFNIIKYKTGSCLYVLKDLKESAVVHHAQNFEKIQYPVLNFYHATNSGVYSHEFKKGELFSDRFEFVDWHDINEDIREEILNKHNLIQASRGTVDGDIKHVAANCAKLSHTSLIENTRPVTYKIDHKGEPIYHKDDFKGCPTQTKEYVDGFFTSGNMGDNTITIGSSSGGFVVNTGTSATNPCGEVLISDGTGWIGMDINDMRPDASKEEEPIILSSKKKKHKMIVVDEEKPIILK